VTSNTRLHEPKQNMNAAKWLTAIFIMLSGIFDSTLAQRRLQQVESNTELPHQLSTPLYDLTLLTLIEI